MESLDLPNFNQLVRLIVELRAEMQAENLALSATAAQGDSKAIKKTADSLMVVAGANKDRDDFARLLNKTQGKL